MRHFCLGLIVTALALPAAASDRIHVASSSTMVPFISAAAEQFGQVSGFAAPVVESLGSGGSLKLFCASIADGSPDIAGASRRITDSEKKSCAASGITDITEIVFGYDGIALASDKAAAPMALTGRQLFLAMAKTVPVFGRLMPNPYTNWHQIDASLPDRPIVIFGPAPNHGTRDVLAQRLMTEACRGFPEIAILEGEIRRTTCQAMREDGPFIEVTADYTVTLRKLETQPAALGIVPFSYLERNRDKLSAASLDGREIAYDTILNGSYPLSRPLYLYVKKAHLQTTQGLRQFLAELTSEKASGRHGYLSEIGLITLPAAQRQAEAEKARDFPSLQ